SAVHESAPDDLLSGGGLVEPGLPRALGGSPVVVHDPWNLGRFQRPRDFGRLLAGDRVDFRLVDLNGPGSDGGLGPAGGAASTGPSMRNGISTSKRVPRNGKRWRPHPRGARDPSGRHPDQVDGKKLLITRRAVTAEAESYLQKRRARQLTHQFGTPVCEVT